MDHQSNSPFQEPPQDNPFASPFVTTPVSYGSQYLRKRSAPTFPKVMAGIDLFFCALRAFLVLSALTAVVGAAAELGNIQQTAWFEIGAGIGICAFGIIAAIGILMGAAWAVPVGWITVACTLASLGIGIWQLTLMMEVMPEGSVERGPFIVGAVGMTFIRLSLLAAYGYALVKFAAWVRERDESAPQW